MNSVFILLNSLNDWKPYCETDSLMTVTDYLEHRYGERTPKLVINLSDEYGYNSEGYYCSLLAQARGHRVLPGVETLNKLESGAGIRMNRNLQQLCQQWIERNRITDETWQLNIYFGTCREKGLEKIARFIFDHYPCPILRVTMNNHARNQIESVQALSLRQLSESGQDDFANALDCFNKKVWRSPRSAKPARYNLAILYDPDEKFPPSDKDALNKFLEVARKMNIHAELITEEEATRLMEFDALFIRATTALNHYTFRLAQRAAMNDIAVIDDPESIIRCTNKVYLCELFEKARIPAPASQLLFRSNEYSFGEISERLGAPFILKIPDGSFSVGMHKVASDKDALNKFLEVARKMNIHAELITEEEATRLMEFDALFIRATTALNHYTFRLAQRAAMNDIAVIDDPESIIRCTNKVYLCELFEKARIPAPASQLLFRSNEYSFGEISERLGAPFILKIPDGSFSVGMHKVASDEELRAALDEMFRHSSVLLAQEFIPTEFDWRIGLLDGEPLFACKYYMAKGHWQIYNHAHDDTGRNLCGAWETVPIYKAPQKVLDTAVKAAALIGKGLYGVDLKLINGRAVVIEINDNPSIDHEVEDAVLGDELYYRILNHFVHCLNRLHAQ